MNKKITSGAVNGRNVNDSAASENARPYSMFPPFRNALEEYVMAINSSNAAGRSGFGEEIAVLGIQIAE